jgi:hypothetical protein
MSGDLHELDAAFELPEVISDVKMRNLYEVIVVRLQKEARNLPMNTVQQLLIERIAYNYIVLRVKERGELGGFNTTNGQRDFNSFWLSMTQEFNRMVGKNSAAEVSDRKKLLDEIGKVILSTISSTVNDPRVRGELLEKMAADLQSVGI